MNQPPDKTVAILKGCKKRKRDAQKELYQEYYGYSFKLCMRYASNECDAVEIMNDAFMTIFNKIDNFDLTKPFKPWLNRILINSAIDHFNKFKKFKNQVDLEEADAEDSEIHQIDNVGYEEILGIVRELPPAYRTVFNLRAIEGYKHEEIAEMLGISESTSRSNYAKAKKKLQGLLNTYFEIDNVG